jgi:hypothetical protein
VILLRAAVAAVSLRAIIDTAPTTTTPAMAAKVLTCQAPPKLAKPEEAQHGHDDNHKADEIDDTVHSILLWTLSQEPHGQLEVPMARGSQ